jgi:type IV pilus assembly protein PilO
MAMYLKLNLNVQDLVQRARDQFEDLDRNDPSSWPELPRYLLLAGVTILCVVALWFVWLSDAKDALKAEQAKENGLKTEYKTKLTKAVNLPALKKKREQVQLYVSQIEKQLPSKAEMDALLSDINQAGLGRSLQFELFRPGQVVVRDYYAELPIAVRVVGKYHDMGAFVADIANLSRIVTLNNLKITPVREGNLSMEATAKTFRYLDSIEVAAQQQAAKGGKKK